MKSKEIPKTKLVVWLTVVCVLACGLCLAGCQPKAETEPAGPDEATAQIDASAYPDFTVPDAGLFPDTYTNREMLNVGNRGCNACHVDLFDQLPGANEETGWNHILVHTGYGKNGTFSDCEPCHEAHTSRCGPYLGDLIHGAHYSNQTFLDANGNCWSCHAINSDGRNEDYQFVLFDDFFDQTAFGGYPWASDDAVVREWCDGRGFPGGLTTGLQLEAEPNVDIQLTQDVTPEEDVYIVNNWGAETTSVNWEEVCDPANEITINGVVNPQSFSKEDLEAMPQTTFVYNHSCATNGPGGVLTSNVEFTGVPVQYVVDLCGGLVPGVNACFIDAYDLWNNSAPWVAESVLNEAYIVTKMYGHDLTEDFGPITVVVRGMPGAMSVKHAKTMNFIEKEVPIPTEKLCDPANPKSFKMHRCNGAWFQNDGLTAKVGEPVDLLGGVYTYYKVSGELEQVRMSFDMGMNWIELDVDNEVADFDPYKATQFKATWTPQHAGTYIVQLDAVDRDGNHFEDPIGLIVLVEE